MLKQVEQDKCCKGGTHILEKRSRKSNERKTRQSLFRWRDKERQTAKAKKEVEEDLIAENQRLRMEIEYLKKLSALVLAEERKNDRKQ